jgi:hypothetical protein
MANITINSLPTASTIDATNDILPIYTSSSAATQGINRNTFLSLSSAPVGLTDTQTLTNKTLTSPTINGATLSGTISGTYTIGGTPTFPSNIVTTTGTQTLTSKTLTSPTISSPTITNATISTDLITGYTTSNTGTVYGVPFTTGTINGSYLTSGSITSTQLAANSVTNASILTGNLYTSKIYNPYKFMIYRAAAYTTVVTTSTRMPFDTKLFDTGSNTDVTTNQGRFTAPVAGYYQFNAQILLTVGSTSRFFIAFAKNSNEYIRSTDSGSSTTTIYGVNLSSLIQLAAGDFVEVNYYTAIASAVTVSTTIIQQTSFSGYLVSAT